MNKFIIHRAALALRFTVNKLHLSSLTSSAPKTCSLLMIIVFGLTQLPIHSAAKVRPKARLVFSTSFYSGPSPLNPGFGMPSGLGKTIGKCIRKTDHGDALYSWQMPEEITSEGAKFQIGVAARASEKGGGLDAVIGCIGIPVKETNLSADIGVAAKPGEGLKKVSRSFTILTRPAYESSFVDFRVRCHGGFDVVFRYTVEQ
jgi:hypothetical protein